MTPQDYILYSGGAKGAETIFGRNAERVGIQVVNFSFNGHQVEYNNGLRVLTTEELQRKDVSLTYVSQLLNRKFSNAPLMRKVLQTIMYQIENGMEVFVVGAIQTDNTVKGGTGWGVEFAKICNKPIFVFDQTRDVWHTWDKNTWRSCPDPKISQTHFTGTGTRFIEANGEKAIQELFDRSF